MKNKYQLGSGWEESGRYKNSKNLQNFLLKLKADDITLQYLKDESLRCSLSRSKSRVRELALSNDFEFFGTITINSRYCDRYSLDTCQKQLRKCLRSIRDDSKKNHSVFKYLIITEKHKDGAFHFHGLFSGLDLSLNEYGFFYNPILSKLGYNSFSFIKDSTRVSSYITKYITKSCVKNSKNQIFIRSKNLDVATKEEINPLYIDDLWKFENDFCCIYDINFDNLSETDKKVLFELYKA